MKQKIIFAGLAMWLGLGLGNIAQAALKSFDNGGGDSQFSNPVNWNGDTAPVAGNRIDVKAGTSAENPALIGPDWTGVAGNCFFSTAGYVTIQNNASFRFINLTLGNHGLLTVQNGGAISRKANTGSINILGTKAGGGARLTVHAGASLNGPDLNVGEAGVVEYVADASDLPSATLYGNRQWLMDGLLNVDLTALTSTGTFILMSHEDDNSAGESMKGALATWLAGENGSQSGTGDGTFGDVFKVIGSGGEDWALAYSEVSGAGVLSLTVGTPTPETVLTWRAPVTKVLVLMPSDAPAEVPNIARVLTRHLTQRCDAEVVVSGAAPLTIQLGLRKGIGKEGFEISQTDNRILVTGNDPMGLIAGVGKLLRSSRFDQGGFSAGSWEGISIPEKALRGIYWATHFRNTYDIGEMDRMSEYIEDMGLLGYNVFFPCYDVMHYSSLEDPLSKEFLDRMIQYLHVAQSVGMGIGIINNSNGSFYDAAPETLRATGGHHGNKPAHGKFHICPSVPAGMDLILDIKRQLFQYLKDCDISVNTVVFWGIDNGGCSCAQCKPWDSIGYLKCTEKSAALVEEIFGPDCKVSLSNWGIDFTDAYKTWAETPPHWLDYVMYTGTPSAKKHSDNLPANVKAINFPDLCNGMRLTVWGPRGGYGANPVPGIIQEKRAGHWATQAGGAPYSEGIWDDANKALVASLYWNSKQNVWDALEEYISSEFSPNIVEEVVAAIRIMEKNSKPSKSNLKSLEFGVERSTVRVPADSLDALALMKKADAKLVGVAKTSWRWRVLYLRALIDSELYRTEGRHEGDVLQQAFDELREIYQFKERPIYVGVPMQTW